MSQRASVYRVYRISTDGGESPNAFRPLITIEIRVFFPPHTPPHKVADLFVNAAAETLNEIHHYVDDQQRNVWIQAPVTTYSAEEITKMDDFAARQDTATGGELPGLEIATVQTVGDLRLLPGNIPADDLVALLGLQKKDEEE